MLIKQFAQFVMHSRKHALIIALVCSALPLFSWVSMSIIALVTLQKGAKEGFLIMLWAVLVYVVFLFIGPWLPSVINIFFGGILVWGLSVLLRRYASWSLVLECAALFGVLVISVVYLWVPNVDGWWAKQFSDILNDLSNKASPVTLKVDQLKDLVHFIAQYATGIQIAFLLFGALMELLIGRGLQALLYNPGGLYREWLQLHLDFVATIVLLIGVIFACLGFGLFKDFLPVLLLPFTLAGISLLHAYLSKYKRSVIFLFYFLLIIIMTFIPVLLGFLVILAMIDSMINFRKHLTWLGIS